MGQTSQFGSRQPYGLDRRHEERVLAHACLRAQSGYAVARMLELGMPIEVSINTEERTVTCYLVTPFMDHVI